MTHLSRLVWREGMYLGPHHFQLQQRYFEESSRFAIEQLFFKPYGLVSCAFDAERLRNGAVLLVHARGILPDGTPFSVPDAESTPPPLDVRALISPTEQTRLVLLALPGLRRDAANVTHDGSATTRLRVVARDIRDETTGREERPVELGEKNLRLTLDDGLRDGEIALPVARLRRAEGGGFAFDEAYVPPLLAIGGSDTLLRLIQRLLDTLDAKSRALAADRRAGGSGMPNYAPSEIANFWLLHTMHASSGPLRHMFSAGQVHPEQLYLECARLAGALCTFTLDAHPRELPAYDHDDPGPCFATLERLIRKRLDWSEPTNFIRVPLEQATLQYTSGSTGKIVTVDGLRGRIVDERSFKSTQWILGVRAPHSPADIITKVPSLVKVCSADGVAFLVAHAYSGFELRHLPLPPASIAPRADTHYFAITRAGACDTLLTSSREVGVYVPHSIPNAVVELLIAFDA
jgi:type VI secretion system protein ImpJ